MDGVYRPSPHGWWYSRDRLIPMGVSTASSATLAPGAGIATFSGKLPTVQTGNIANLVQIPIMVPVQVHQSDGAYRTHVHTRRRLAIISEGRPGGTGVTLSMPVGSFGFTGFAPNLNRVLNAPRGEFTADGLTPSVSTQFGGTRRERQSKALERSQTRRERRR